MSHSPLVNSNRRGPRSLLPSHHLMPAALPGVYPAPPCSSVPPESVLRPRVRWEQGRLQDSLQAMFSYRETECENGGMIAERDVWRPLINLYACVFMDSAFDGTWWFSILFTGRPPSCNVPRVFLWRKTARTGQYVPKLTSFIHLPVFTCHSVHISHRTHLPFALLDPGVWTGNRMAST